MEMITKALAEGRTTLSEYESKQVLSAYGIPVTREVLVSDIQGLVGAAADIGYPLVLKLLSVERVPHSSDPQLDVTRTARD